MNTFKCRSVVLIVVLLLPNVAASADAAKEVYEKGKASFGKRDYDAAIAAFSEAIRLNPTNVEAYCDRGNAYSFRGLAHARNLDFDKATADFTEAIRLILRMSRRTTIGPRLQPQGRTRQGDCRLHRGYWARPKVGRNVLQPRLRL